MDNIKTTFTIKDLENLSGIKAHTIRIWEKRYNLFSPDRTNTNIRYYDIDNLQKLLNVSFLNNNGSKISKIAALSEADLARKTRELVAEKAVKGFFINAFKIAMLNFDQSLFENTYQQLLAQKSFKEIFLEDFMPLLNEIGLLWQTKTIRPANEHFISNLIKQKILINIERLTPQPADKKEEVYVLYLPINEIHELGLLYIHYELLLKNHFSIYLGQSVPLEDLVELQKIYTSIHFISYFTVKPDENKLADYLSDIKEKVLGNRNDPFSVLGYRLNQNPALEIPPGINRYNSLEKLLRNL